MIKGIIFDMDGVLLDTEKFHYLAWKHTFETKHIHLSKEDYNKYCQAQGRLNAINNILGNPTEQDITELSNLKATYYKEAIDSENIMLYEDAKGLLSYLKEQKITLSIASSSVVADYVIYKADAHHLFSHIVTGNDIKRNKPYPDIFNEAASKYVCDKSELAVVEDSIAGVIASRLAGINVFAINRNQSLKGTNPLNIDIHIKDLNLELNQQELNNITQSKTILVDSLMEIPQFLQLVQ